MASEAEREELIASPRMGRKRLIRVNCLIPFLFLTTIIVAFWIVIGRAEKPKMGHHIKLTTVPGYFLQDDPKTDPGGFDYTATNFGLIDRSYKKDSEIHDSENTPTPWQRFEHEVSRLNSESNHNTNYKVLFMGRHGEGDHNVAEAFYGTKAWDCYWSLQDGNATSNWVDAHLTPTGIAQAQKANAFWKSLIRDQKIPCPQSYYSSPLRRCCATASITFTGLDLPAGRPFTPTIKELFREVIGAHTCDKRSAREVIAGEYPGFVFEEGFAEEDPLFEAELRETDEATDQRSKEVLDDVFGADGNTWISVSTHSGEISSILRVIQHREFRLGTGQVIPVLVKAEKLPGAAPKEEKVPWMKITKCAEPPPPPPGGGRA